MVTTTTNTTNVLPASNPNCATTQGSTCTACRRSFSLNSNQCVPLPNADDNCLNYVNFRCTICSIGLVLSPNAQCIIQNCQTMSPAGTCLQCNIGYSVTAQGTACSVVTVIANCNTSSNGVCTRCINGYYLNTSGQCQQTNANC